MTWNDYKAFRATTAPGAKPPNFSMDVDINDFHCSFGHVHEGLSARDGEAAKCQSHWHAVGVPRVPHSQWMHETHLYDNGNTSS